LLKALDRWIKNFIWSGDVPTKKVCTLAWSDLCNLWADGGHDLKPTRFINEFLILQLGWKLVSAESQWSSLFKKRYFKQGKPVIHYFKSSV